MKPLTIDSIRSAIRKVARNQPIDLVYLFGSRASGKEDKESDIDIAVLARSTLSGDERFDLRLTLLTECARALGLVDETERMDVVVLQDASILLQHNVIRARCPLFQKSVQKRAIYESRVWKLYDDEVYYLDRENALTLRSLLSPSRHP